MTEETIAKLRERNTDMMYRDRQPGREPAHDRMGRGNEKRYLSYV